MDTIARQIIADWENKRTGSQRVHLLSTDHREQKRFESFGRKLSALAPSLRLRPSDKKHSLPGFLLKANIIYSALAQGRELPPFLKGLSCILEQTPKPSDFIQKSIDQLALPCSLTLYIAPHCPHCPGVVDTLFPLAVFSEKIALHIIDGTLFPEAAQRDNVMSAPCLILDNGFQWTGAVALEEVLSMILHRDVSSLSAQTLRAILEQGNASWISREMARADRIFEGFIPLLLDDTWSVRLGAMVVVETLVQERPDLALQLCPKLIRAFDQKDIPVQGDILYALGETGNLETKEWLKERLQNLGNQELKEAAEDAIQAIESRIARQNS
ncbi:MAG: thioredoxin family protein [Proteobacteria bacterium]|nr:thioredoxin family protein [Pseudomonadota bacterium]